MKRRAKVLVGLVVVVCGIGVAFLVQHGHRSTDGVVLTMRIAVTPQEQSASVLQEANAAKFKYLVGKQTGLKPSYAQKLVVKNLHEPGLLEARVPVATPEQAKQYRDALFQMLRFQFGNRAKFALSSESVD